MRLKIIAMMMTILVVSLPMAFAISINPGSVKADSVSDSGVTIKWNTDIGGAGEVRYGVTADPLTTVPETGGPVTSHSVRLSNLQQGQKYYYRVYSYETAIPTNDALSGFYDFTTLLSAPTGLKTTDVKYNQAVLAWNSNSGASKYRIYKNTQYLGESTTSTYTAVSLSASTGYTFQVSAVDSLGRESGKSASLTVSTPAKPMNITFLESSSITTDSATISWETDQAVACSVHYGKDTGMGQSKAETQAKTGHSLALSSLDLGTRYYYKVVCGAFESSTGTFDTLSQEPEVVISGVTATDITAHSATISWQTNIDSAGTVRYSTDDSFSSSGSSPELAKEHEVSLENLDAGATYYYKVDTGSTVSSYKTFTTTESTGGFIVLAQTPAVTNNNTIVVSGDTRNDARVYIFVNGNKVAQVQKQITGTHFSFSVVLDPGKSYKGIDGNNYVEVYSWDSQGNKDVKSFYVVCDTSPPILTLGSIPKATTDNRLLVSGTTEPGAKLQLYINERSQGEFSPEANGSFKQYLSLGSDGKYNFSVSSTDAAGNTNMVTRGITVDRNKPSIEFTSDFTGETHFKIFKVSGKTEPGAKVEATNFGEFTGCSDVNLKAKYGSCEQFVHNQNKYDEFSGLIDVVSYGLGMETETTADENGEFSLSVVLVPKEKNQASTNTIIFNVTGANGLTATATRRITYKPGCSDWRIGNIESYPFNIYTRELTQSDIDASAFFPIQYMGTGTPKISVVEIERDKSNQGYLMEGQDQMAELIDIPSGGKASMYDEENKQFYVYTPITVKKYSGEIRKLPDQLNAFLYVQITYSVPGEGEATCRIYPVVAFDINKPELLSKWLSPEMINNTIKDLDKAINQTKMIINNLRIASVAGLIACGAMIAYNYVKGFFGSSTETDENGCTDAQEGLSSTYWVCDRMLCPNVAPRCDNFTQDAGTSDSWTTKIDDDEINIQYYSVDSKGHIEGDYQYLITDKDNKININIDNQFKTEAKTCKGGTIIAVYKRSEDTDVGVYNVGKQVKQVDVRCQNTPKSQMKPPDVANLKGCYNDQCPQFDNTKCFGKDDIEPAGGLWSSARCACLPGLMSHLKNWLQIMEGTKKCLQQAQIGEVRGGYCERLLAQFVCDILIEAFKYALSWADTSTATGDTGIRSKLVDYKTNADQLSSSLSDRYGDIVKNKVGLSSDQLVNKACVVAFTGDWSLLDGVIDNIVESVETEPIVYLEAESRPYGYDPFTGRMNIGYNVYAGIVPGGETDIKVWLECDRNYPGGEYCGSEADPITVPQVPAHMSKDDAPFNQNIVFTDSNAIWWYNKAVMQVKYQVGGQSHTETITKQIWRKGDISASCHFSMIGGISCDLLSNLNPSGIVELYSASQGSHVSPTVPRYREGEPVSALVKVRNSFIDPFYIIVQYPGTSQPPVEYTIPGAGETKGEWANVQYLDLWLDNAGTTGSTTTTGTGTTATTNWPALEVNSQLNGAQLEIGLDKNYIKGLTADIYYTATTRSASGTTSMTSGSFECTIPDTSQNTDYGHGVYVDGSFKSASAMNHDPKLKESYCEKYSMGEADTYSSCMDFDFSSADFNRIDGGKYKCIIPYDNFGSYNAVSINQISRIAFKNPVWVSEDAYKTFSQMNVQFLGLGSFTSATIPPSGTTATAGTTSKRSVTINVYQDTNDNGHGDTPIVMAGSTGDQTVTFTYSIGTPTDDQPRVEIVEPTADYFNNDGNAIPIGLNVWNADKDKVEVRLRSTSKSGIDCTFSTTKLDCPYGTVQYNTDRSTYPASGEPPFMEFLFTPSSTMPKEPTDIYEIKVTATSPGGKTRESDPRRFSFDKSGQLTQQDLMVCLGSGTCGSAWAGPGQTTETLGKFNQSGMPRVRS